MKENNGIEVLIMRNLHESSQVHSELELIFVIQGTVEATIGQKKYPMRKNDIILIDSNIRHSVINGEDTILCQVIFSYQFISNMIPDFGGMFFCNSVVDKEQSYQEIRNIFYELVYQYFLQRQKSECMRMCLVYRLLDCLIERYWIEDYGSDIKQSDADVRMRKIFGYISQHFLDKINMAELASMLYISPSTLSKFFKKQTGMYFVEYVNQMRAREAAKALAYSDISITKAAVESGFSNLAVFNKTFKGVYAMTPTEYRNTIKKKTADYNKEFKSIQEQVREELLHKDLFGEKNKEHQEMVLVEVDVGQESQKLQKNWCNVINIGAVSRLTLANLQFHTLYLKENLGIRYIRIWNIFSAKLQMGSGKEKCNYNFDELDQVFDFLVSNHIKLFLDLGRRPDMALKSEGKTIFYKEEYIEFESKKAYEKMLDYFLRHIIRRYGEDEVSSWIFELSYHPENPYYNDAEYDFFEVFSYAFKVIKEKLPQAQVGGINVMVQKDNSFLEALLMKCTKERCSPDFLSFMLFPYYKEVKDGIVFYRRLNSESYAKDTVKVIKEILQKKEAEEGYKIYITEWNQSLSNRSYLNDSSFRATYIAKQILEISDQVDLMCLWMASDWVSNYFDSLGISYGGSGILTKDSICKPAYYALWFMNSLGDELIKKGENYIVTKRNDRFFIVCFNRKSYGSNYFVKHEDEISISEVKDVFLDNGTLKMKLILRDLPADGEYMIKRFHMHDSEGGILGEWSKFQYDPQLEGEDVKYIRNACCPRIYMERKKAENGKLEIILILKAQEISLIQINPNA